MVSASEAAEEYRTVLADLTRNDKTQINLLTILAEDYASYSSEIVAVIDDTLHKCPAALKIVILYVVDSILKNIKAENGAYRDLFARKIVDMIVHVFKESDERTRASIYRLRCTWGDVFPKSRLYMMDTKINAIDKAWPIIHPTATVVPVPPAQPAPGPPGNNVVHVNPRFLNGKPSTPVMTDPRVKTTATSALKSESKKEPMVVAPREEVATVSSTTPEPSGLTVTIENSQAKGKVVKQEPMETSEEPRKVGEKTKSNARVEKTRGRGEEKDKCGGKRTEKRKDSGAGRAAAPKKTAQPRQVADKEVAQQQKRPESLLSLKLMQPPQFLPQPQSAGSQPPPMKRPRRTMPPPPQSQAPPQAHPPQRPQHPPKPPQSLSKMMHHVHAPSEPTTALGAHAFGLKASAAPAVPTTTSLIPPLLTISSIPPVIPPVSTAVAPPPFIPQQQSIPVIPPQQQHHIQNVTPRLPGVPENNRIFVDGKAYEVFYLDEAAVIERNGLPHRVSFAGPPRDVIIDGAAHRMAFGELKQVLIDGDVHVLRFGAPSRELYMGNFPFKGAFGGPPIIATINQRRHEIRLCGPPPEVRIDPEPSYELMRYMPAVRQQQQPLMPKVEPKTEQPSIDVTKLLKRLKETGLLAQQPTEAERKQRERQAAIEAKNAAIASLNAPPIPSNHRLDNIERRATPMSGLDQFSMRSLIIRYDSVIDSIHRPRVVCQYCGIAFQELYSEAYQRHADWHLQNTIRMEDQKLNKGPKVVKGTRSQPWYILDDWFEYSETELVNRAQGPAGQDGGDKSHGTADADSDKTTTGTMPTIGAGTGNRDASSEMVELKECQVCHEPFEEYWDEDEDVWRLRECVVVDGRAFHSFCKEDADPTTTASTTSTTTTTNAHLSQTDIADT